MEPLPALILLSTVLSILATFYSLLYLVKEKRKQGVKAVLLSFGSQILLWDSLRCLTIGFVSGLYHLNTPSLDTVCTIIGPLTDMSHRLPFFLCLGHVIGSFRKTQNSGLCRRLGVATVVLGYLISIVFSLLPFTQHNSYVLGYEGFCTYYADMALPYTVIETFTEQDYMKWNIILSFVPFAVMFGVLVCGVGLAVCFTTTDITSILHALSLLFSYLPMLGVGVALVASYFGVSTLLFSYDEDTYLLMMWIQMSAMVVLPVLKPLVTVIFGAVVSTCRAEGGSDSEHINKEYSQSTAILVHNIEGGLE